jgi:hypothetical protein
LSASRPKPRGPASTSPESFRTMRLYMLFRVSHTTRLTDSQPVNHIKKAQDLHPEPHRFPDSGVTTRHLAPRSWSGLQSSRLPPP